MRNTWLKKCEVIKKMNEKVKKILTNVGIFSVAALIIAAIMASLNTKTPNSEKVWYPEMTMGNMDAKNYFVIYSDIACPYCIAFENAMVENKEELEQYIADNDILIEVRATDFLYEFGESNPVESRYAAVATYCAKDQGKFWDFYDTAVATVWNDYFKDSGKGAFTEFNKNGKDYWVEMGKSVGLGDEFESCVQEDKTLAAVMADADKMRKYVTGLPYFKFNNFISSGYDLGWGWDYVLKYFEAGLKS